jgi:hypothetical protein
MTDAKTDTMPCDESEAENPQRRNLAMALFGALGSAAFLEACASDIAEPEKLGVVAAALNGTLNYADKVCDLRAITGGSLGWIAVLGGYASRGDGGGGIFIWDTTAAVDDSGLFFNNVSPPSAAAGWRRIYSGPIDVRWFGAVGTSDATTAFTKALAAGNHVLVPRGSYAVSGFSIPQDTTLELHAGATITTSGTITLNAHRARLVGNTNSMTSTNQPTAGWNIQWNGGPNGNMIEVGTAWPSDSNSPTGCHIRGIHLYGNEVVGITGILAGTHWASPPPPYPSIGAAWLQIFDVTITDVKFGFTITCALQQCEFRNLCIVNLPSHTNYQVAGSLGLDIGTGSSGDTVITALDFNGLVVQGFETLVQLGSASGVGVAHVSFRGRVVLESLPTNGGCAINAQGGGPYFLRDIYFEGPGNGTTVGVRVGTPSSAVRGFYMTHCNVQGFATAWEGHGWDGLFVRDCTIDYSAGNSVMFSNVSGGTAVKRAGYWGPNAEFPGTGSFDFGDAGESGFWGLTVPVRPRPS